MFEPIPPDREHCLLVQPVEIVTHHSEGPMPTAFSLCRKRKKKGEGERKGARRVNAEQRFVRNVLSQRIEAEGRGCWNPQLWQLHENVSLFTGFA